MMEESRRVRLTKRLMKDALLELMEKYPINRITVTAICETADVHRTTFYKHYADPLQLLEDIENEIIEQMPATPYQCGINDPDRFAEVNTEFYDYVKENARAFRVLLIDSTDNRFYNRILEAIQGRYFDNKLDRMQTRDSFLYMYTVYGALGMLIEWLRHDFPVSSEEYVRMVYEFSLRCLGPDGVKALKTP